MTKKLEISIAIICSLIGLLQTYGQEQPVQELVDVYRTTYAVPAIAASVILEDTIYYGVSGYKNVELKNAIDIHSKFHLGSNAKAITATIAAQLIAKGTIEWDTKLLDAVPELRGQIHPGYTEITLQDLLLNRAMIHAFEDDGSSEWRNIPASVRTATDQKLAFAQYALNLEPVVPKDADFHYSNGGFIIAGLMLERLSGKPWNTLCDSLMNPLGLTTSNGFPNQENLNETYGHKKKGKRYTPIDPADEYPLDAYFAPAGNQSMSLKDLSALIQLHLKGLMGSDNFLEGKTYEKLHYGMPGYAFGWYNGTIGDGPERFSYHGGSIGTFSSAIMLSADRKVALVILVNADNKKVNTLKDELRKALWETYGAKDR